MKYIKMVALVFSFCIVFNSYTKAGYIVVDPGHGGPGADMYNNGGGYNQGRGAVGPVEGISEQWVNLDVALDLLNILGGSNCILTRMSDTQNVSYQERIDFADDIFCDLFLSIHHNGLPLEMQATEIRWCSDDLNSAGLARDNDYADSTFAKKTLYKLLDAFEYDNRCWIMSQPDPIGSGCQDCDGDPWILKNVNRQHVLSEASNINDTTEEYLYYSSSLHAEREAAALDSAYLSWITGQGFGRIEYEYLDANPLTIDICTVQVNFYPYDVPYERTWLIGESKTLEAFDYFIADGYTFTFHHWAEVWYSNGTVFETFLQNPLYVVPTVAHDGYHFYEAYYTGGLFNISLLYPDSQTLEIQQNDTITILWDASPGVNQTCSLYIDLSINNGSTWSTITGPIPYNNTSSKNTGTYNWIVPNLISYNCYLRLRAFDIVDNIDTLISHKFGIDCYEPTAKFYANKYSGENPLTINFYDESTHDPTGWQWNFGDGSASTAKNPSHIYDSAGIYTVSLTATNQCGSDDSVMVDLINVSCELTTNFISNIISGFAPLQVIFFDSSDPRYSGNYYLWEFGDGDSSLALLVTSHNYTSPGVIV